MIGFPYHAADNYLRKMAKKHKVAIAETKDDIRLLPEEEDDYDDLTEEEMRKFDGDIEEPKDIDDELGDRFDTSAFDKTALCKLDEIFEDKLALRWNYERNRHQTYPEIHIEQNPKSGQQKLS